MTEAAPNPEKARILREAALLQRRVNFKEGWLEIRDDDPWAEFETRRMFAMEIILQNPDLKPNAASFLGQACVDKNKFSARQSEWLTVLVNEFLDTTPPKPEPKSKKKTEAGK